MEVEQALTRAIAKLQSRMLQSEAQVKQAVILPVLRSLGWDDSDPESFLPEYSVDTGFVDIALLDRGSPLVFIEAKRVGAIDASGENQLFNYASNRGVPLLVLTDGNRWDFYLSMAEGIPTERRFYRLELELEHRTREYAKFLEDHLLRSRIISGEARRSAESRHLNNRERERARQGIPTVWRALLQQPDDFLRDLLAEEVEKSCGTKPELDDVEQFLRTLPSDDESHPTRNPRGVPRPKSSTAAITERASKKSRIVGYVLHGQRVEVGTAIKTLTEVLKQFDGNNPHFMERFEAKTVGRNRKLVSRNRDELYKKSAHLIADHSVHLGNGWWLGTNLSKAQVRERVIDACNVAGVSYGSQLQLIER